MIKILFPKDISAYAESTFKYFISLSDELDADVSVLKKGGDSDKQKRRIGLKERFPFKLASGALREAISETRLYPYDLVLAGNLENRAWWARGWLDSVTQLAKRSWCPVLLVPESGTFKPVSNVLFIDCQGFVKKQPLFKKLGRHWEQNHFRYPGRRSLHGPRGYCFDETGYRIKPGIAARGLEEYIRKMDIGLIVVEAEKADSDWEAFRRLPVPVLVFNARNLARRNSTASIKPGSFLGSLTYNGKQK